MAQKNERNEKIDRALLVTERHVNVECGLHIHAAMEIVVVTEGILHMTVSGKNYSIPRGYGILVSPFEPHQFHSPYPNRCHVLMFSGELVRYFFEFIRGNIPTSHLFAVSEPAMALSEELFPLDWNTSDYLCAEAVLSPLCYDAWRGCRFEKRKAPSDDTVGRILAYMDGHFCEELSLEEVARAVGVHPVTVSKILSARVGVGFHDYLNYQRCVYAATVIRTCDTPFSQIAYESGFGSIRSFNRAFRQFYGVTPTEYKMRDRV